MDIPEAELRIIQKIEDRIFSSIRLGVDMAELDILDDVNAGKADIQKLGSSIAVNNPEISAVILQIAHSIYFTHFVEKEVPDFFDAVFRMGADRVKILIFSLTLFALGKGREARMRAAKGASIGVLGKLIAEEMNLTDELVRKVETGGLLSQLGKNCFLKARELGMDVSDEMIQRYETVIALRIIERLNLDPFLKQAIDMTCVEFDEDSLSLTGIIKLAEALTEESFRKYGKLVLKSPLPDRDNIVTRTPGSAILNVFNALDLGEFLEIREIPTKRQREAALREEKKP